ncbi:sporulation protein [Brevibacillus composti]|uniref:Sporulation protein n=1 Tax=Brevibacillus composti TaxID=2796470 RepID=A0A7T5EKK9_9BACL|nr:sporulation protein [Brevibacillus composti]QQE74241.1 sporulation protein [Brevibacillus composti]QUO41323.1 sporulation protein [Brevibacillus composti]
MQLPPNGKRAAAAAGAVVLLLAMATGCGRTMPQESSYGAKSYDPQQHATIKSDRSGDIIDRGAPPIEDRDKLMGRNQNPNLIIGHPEVSNYQVDMDNMEMMARSVQGVENARITLSGGNAYVTLDLIPNVTANEARNIEQQVIAALRQKVPRYDFHVTSNDGYHR